MPLTYNHDHEHEIAVFAETNFRNQQRRFGIKTDDRRRHMYVVGKTGMGKTNLLENLVYNDIMAGHGVGIVDPHGDFAERILDFVPSHRINDVIYVNPSDVEHPIAFNILETVDETHKHLIASGLMGVFKKIWPDVWSARMEYILNNTVLALLDYPGSTLLGINRMLADNAFRKKVITKIHDPVVRAFWVNEFSRYNERYASEAIAPIQNKVGQFLSTPIIRNLVGQVKSTIDVREIMDTGKIFIMNLSKGRVGEDNSRLLGGMLITKIQLATMERVDTVEDNRPDFYLYVDEFQNFATESFSNILSEARKYHLNLTIAHQYIEQLDEKVAAAVFGNVGTLITFRVGGADALKLVQEFTPRFTEEDLVNLTKYTVYLKLMIDGVASDPFSARILPPLSEVHGNRDTIIAVSRERYGKDRAIVEDKISRWSEGLIGEEGGTASTAFAIPPRRSPALLDSTMSTVGKPALRKSVAAAVGPEYQCSRCGNMTMLTFVPDPTKPIYCKDCLKTVREELRVKKERQAASGVFSKEGPKRKVFTPVPLQQPVPRREGATLIHPVATMNLSEALRQTPVDFRGKKLKRPSERLSERPPAPTPSVPSKPGILKPGQTIRLAP